MTAQEIVVDTNVFIVSLIDQSRLNAEEQKQRPLAVSYINGLQSGRYVIHLPRIAVIEIAGVTRVKAGIAIAAAIKNRLAQWVGLGLIRLYDLQEPRTTLATDLVIQHNLSRRRSLSAPDATFIALAEELEIPLITFEKYFNMVSPRVLVPS